MRPANVFMFVLSASLGLVGAVAITGIMGDVPTAPVEAHANGAAGAGTFADVGAASWNETGVNDAPLDGNLAFPGDDPSPPPEGEPLSFPGEDAAPPAEGVPPAAAALDQEVPLDPEAASAAAAAEALAAHQGESPEAHAGHETTSAAAESTPIGAPGNKMQPYTIGELVDAMNALEAEDEDYPEGQGEATAAADVAPATGDPTLTAARAELDRVRQEHAALIQGNHPVPTGNLLPGESTTSTPGFTGSSTLPSSSTGGSASSSGAPAAPGSADVLGASLIADARTQHEKAVSDLLGGKTTLSTGSTLGDRVSVPRSGGGSGGGDGSGDLTNGDALDAKMQNLASQSAALDAKAASLGG